MSRTRQSRMRRGPPTLTRFGERVREGKRCEPMQEASSEHCARQCGGGRVSVKLVECWTALTIAERGDCGRSSDRRSAFGKELRSPKARIHTGYSRFLIRTMECVRNLGTSSWLPRLLAPRMIETADDRRDEGRSLRSSPRTGKPFTWRREAVDTVSRQEAGECPTR
jgi:hypothetical protein